MSLEQSPYPELIADVKNKLTHPRVVLERACEGRASPDELRRAIGYIDQAIRMIEAITGAHEPVDSTTRS